MFKRDRERFEESFKRVNVLPLGSAALAGSTFNLDRQMLAEELGFAGVMLLFALYLVLFYRLLRIIVNTQDVYGRMLVIGALAMILFPLIVNVGMNLGMLPISGLPLPFITYGNSALLTTMIGIGIAENVAVRRRKLEFQAG